MYHEAFVGFVIILMKVKSSATWFAGSTDCDDAQGVLVQQGNVGQTARFPWLGVLRAHYHSGVSNQILVTGAVLVHPQFVLAYADDIAKIPPGIFKNDCKAQFIPSTGELWSTKLRGYTLHPEYEYTTYDTIALVELEHEDHSPGVFDFKPVCLPEYKFNTSDHLYVLGFTDENKLLEKYIYRLQYVEKTLCDEFFSKAKKYSSLSGPTFYECGFAKNNTQHCDFENGSVMASNATGIWTLIGLGMEGPGCSAPARFVDLSPYTSWIHTVTSPDEYEVDYDMLPEDYEFE